MLMKARSKSSKYINKQAYKHKCDNKFNNIDRKSNESVSSKRSKLACALIEHSDQPAHMCSRTRVFDGHSMGSQGRRV